MPAAGASTTGLRSGPGTFVTAHAAAEAGDARRAAMLYASLAWAEPENRIVADRALAQAISAGDMPLALRLARGRDLASLAPDARMLLLAEQLKARPTRERDIGTLPAELDFMSPFVRAWVRAERGRTREAVAALDAVPADSPLAGLVAEHKALIYLQEGDRRAALPLIPTALERAGARSDRLRIAFAAGLVRSGSRDEGLALLGGNNVTHVRAATALRSARRPDLPVASAAQGLSELLLGVAVALGGGESGPLALAFAQVARHADPANTHSHLLLADLLDGAGRPDDALALLQSMLAASPFTSDARDSEVRILLRAERLDEALARAQAFVAPGDAQADDWSRLGDVFDAMKRHAPAAEAYGRALALVETGRPGPERWSLHLLRGAALEQADRWTEAETALEAAHALAPANPIVLNYLGYARLERGAQLDKAEALIAEASRLAPGDASITDSLGWAQFKRGKVEEAVATLQRAARADPAQAEIHEHLGDALYTAGRKFEARFAWHAALVTAEENMRERVEAKIASGLSKATAAP